jgi:site-specific DNA-cytosine methylase
VATLRSLELRYLTPREVSRLMRFPETFRFPPDTSTMQKYRVLGNSVKVIVVAFLMKQLV